MCVDGVLLRTAKGFSGHSVHTGESKRTSNKFRPGTGWHAHLLARDGGSFPMSLSYARGSLLRHLSSSVVGETNGHKVVKGGGTPTYGIDNTPQGKTGLTVDTAAYCGCAKWNRGHPLKVFLRHAGMALQNR